MKDRREVLKVMSAVAAASVLQPVARAIATGVQVAGHDVNVYTTNVSPHCVRITVAENRAEAAKQLAEDNAVVLPLAPASAAAPRGLKVTQPEPLSFAIADNTGRVIQTLRVDAQTGAIHFSLGKGAVLGMGEGGPQFDRRTAGQIDRMRSGQGGYRLRTHGGRVPIQWLMSTAGWALYIHQPLGSIDLTGEEGVFTLPEPGGPGTRPNATPTSPLPIDLFVVDAADPARALGEYARITGKPEMPPLWSLGYQQSHRTITTQDVFDVAKTMREKKLPCDALIYLGTGFCPSGWNTDNGEFTFNPKVFPDAAAMIRQLHDEHYKVVLHVVLEGRRLSGAVDEPCAAAPLPSGRTPDGRWPDNREVSCYWPVHKPLVDAGADGWWPDQGDGLDAASRLARIRMYWDGPRKWRPNERPYALHRNGYAGMQRYAGFLWSGDVYSTWETLRTHVPDAINTGLSGIPYWGTDTGGFVPTKEFTGELYVRWFQFSAFCPLMRSHGRTWKLRLPWGWNTGELGPNEVATYGDASNPDASELHNAEVEPICKKYLELRYRLLPYLYTAVRESHDTGLPIMRALWLHYPQDAASAMRGDEYLFGRDILVAPVVEKGATTRTVYLPPGDWYDFWTEEKIGGGREVTRNVDLGTTPLYVRAGAVIPFAPLRQYTAEKVSGPTTLVVYPGPDAAYTLYEDDGQSFNYRNGEWMKTEFHYDGRKLSARLAPGSKMLAPAKREYEVRVAGSQEKKPFVFRGAAVSVAL